MFSREKIVIEICFFFFEVLCAFLTLEIFSQRKYSSGAFVFCGFPIHEICEERALWIYRVSMWVHYPTRLTQEKNHKYKFTASTGGLLGLFMGFSFLSVMEIVYFLTIRLVCRWYNVRQKPQKSTAQHKTHLPDDSKKVIYPFTNWNS